jgi:hypothetical protein
MAQEQTTTKQSYGAVEFKPYFHVVIPADAGIQDFL